MSGADGITLTVEGRQYESWKSVQVVRTIEALASSFALEASRQSGSASIGIRPRSLCEVRIGGDPVCTGRVEDISASYTATSRTIGIQGRSLSGTLVDCSVLHSSGQWRGATVAGIAQQLVEPYGLKLECADFSVVPRFGAQWGETVEEALQRLARMRGLLLTDSPSGTIRMVPLVAGRADVALQAGVNILEASLDLAGSEQYSTIRVQGARQRSGEDAGLPTIQVEAAAINPDITDRRELIIPAEADVTPEYCARRAQWEQAARAARAVDLKVVVQGWRQTPGGVLWAPGLLVNIADRLLDIRGELLITQVTYELGSRGTIATLSLRPPEAFIAEPLPEKVKRRATRAAGAWEELRGGV